MDTRHFSCIVIFDSSVATKIQIFPEGREKEGTKLTNSIIFKIPGKDLK
jgi:hypothetical protein